MFLDILIIIIYKINLLMDNLNQSMEKLVSWWFISGLS